jgi:putative RNA 2'-phosphotransferase
MRLKKDEVIQSNVSLHSYMFPEKLVKQTSKFLSLVLRHQPGLIGINLDPQGWVNTGVLLQQMNLHGHAVTAELLQHVVQANAKQRFAFSECGTRIRASQGHSVAVDLGLHPSEPPQLLYHGTCTANLVSILQSGILKRDRQHVHLSTGIDTALQVGRRHGVPVVLAVRAGSMHRHGFCFYLSENKVWLTEHVPPVFLEKVGG